MAKSKNKSLKKENKKLPYNVFKRGIVGALLGVSMLTTGTLLSGCSGSDGQDGKDGATWLTGTSTPTAQQGKKGDFYYDIDDYILYQKGDVNWNVLVQNFGKPGQEGTKGDEVVFNITNTKVEWKYSKEPNTAYRTLVNFSAITGDNAVLRVQDGEIQWKLSKQPDSAYQPLIELSELTGQPGDQVVFTADGNYIKWKYKDEDVSAYRELVALSTLKGNEGKSAYEVAKDAGFVGDEQAWLESLKGVSIVDVDIEYTMDNQGNEYAIYIIHYSDDTSSEPIRVPMPARAQEIYLQKDRTIFKCDEGQEPTLKIRVRYVNGTEGYVDVTDDMFVVNNEYKAIDYQTAGTYNVKIIYRGAYCTDVVEVVDPDDTTPTHVSLNNRDVLMLLDNENKIISNTAGLKLFVQRKNETYEVVKLSDPRVSYSIPTDPVGSEDPVSVTVTFEEGEDENRVILEDTLSIRTISETEFNAAQKNIRYTGNSNILCELNGSPFTEEDCIVTQIVGESAYYYQQATDSMLVKQEGETPFSSASEQEDVTYKFNIEGCSETVDITVYDPAHLTIISTQDVYLEIGTELETAKYTNYIYGQTQVCESLTIMVDESDLTITDDGGYDKDVAGTYTVKYTYKEKQGEFDIIVYDPSVCNISSMSFDNSLPNFAYGETTVDAYVNTNIVGKNLTVYYYEEIGGKYSETVTITKNMIDVSRLNPNKIGQQEIGITYTIPGQTGSKTLWKYVTVVAEVTGEPLAVCSLADLEGFGMATGCSTISLYNNGIAQTEDGTQFIYDKNEYLTNGIFKYEDANMNGYGYFKVETVGQDKKLAIYTEAGTTAAETYDTVWSIYDMEIPLQITIWSDESPYDEDGGYYAVVSMNMMGSGYMDYTTVWVEVDGEEDVMRALGKVYNIVAGTPNKTLTEQN